MPDCSAANLLLCCENMSEEEEEEDDEDEESEKEEEEEEEEKGNHESCHSPSSSSSSLLLLNLWESSSASWRVSAAMAMEESCDVETTLSELGEREIFHMPSSDYSQRYEKKILDPCSRQKAVDWLFKVRAFYNFGPLTAALSVNYLDRFLSLHQLPNGKAWMMQLLSVACLSLAAKMEETEVPLLLDLQVVGPLCIFEPKTIQRMELLVLSTLGWRLGSITPFSYIDYLVRKLDLASGTRCILCARINELILCAVQEIRFLTYRPSSIAVAAVLCAAQEVCATQFDEFKKILFSIYPQCLHDLSERCFVLMVDLFLGPITTSTKGETCGNSIPRSPIAVLDASFSSDSESAFKSIASDPSIQVSSPPPLKRKKIDHFGMGTKVYAT